MLFPHQLLPSPSFEFIKDDVKGTYEMWVLKNGQPTLLAMLDQGLGKDIRFASQFKQEVWWLLNVTPNVEPFMLGFHD